VPKISSSKLLLVFAFVPFTFCSPSFSYDFAGGTGEPNDPYRIETAEQLLQIDSDPNLLDKFFILNNDIDLDPNVTGIPPFTQAPIAPDFDNSNFNFDGIPFTGIFDGNDHKINNLIIDTTGADSDFLGLFGLVSGEQTQVRNLGIENVSITGGNNLYFIGGLCGRNDGSIRNCYSTGSIWCGNSSHFVGGLIGYNNNGSISNCYSICIISGYANVGGLCGYNHTGSIVNCYAASSIDGADYLGGLCGYNYNGSVTNCYAAGTVNNSGSYYVGGLCGRKNSGSISNSYFYMYSGPDNGLGTILEESQPGKERFVGFDFAGDPNDGTDDDWIIVSGHCPKLTWQTDDGPLIPAPPATTLLGSGYPDDPFLINSESDFIEFYSNNNLTSGYYTLTTDVYLSGQTFTTAIINRIFGGHFEGGANIISNLTIDTNGDSIDYLGLFREIRGASAEINNLGIIDCNITGGEESNYVGGLCGMDYGSINNCYSTGLVSGFSGVGGLIGSGSTVSNSFSKCTVSGQIEVGGFCGVSGGGIDSCYAIGTILGSDNASSIGGFCGLNFSRISNCYAKGDVSSGNDSSNIGGFCGENTSTFTIISCYSTGAVSAGDNSSNIGGLCGDNTYGTVITSFWDIETSSQTNGIGYPEPDPDTLIGLPTEQMQIASTFIDAGWDFNDIWAICEGTNYPRLQWQILPADFFCPDGVDFIDYSFFSNHWLMTDCNDFNDCDSTDFDLSGCVDGNDLKTFTDFWLKE